MKYSRNQKLVPKNLWLQAMCTRYVHTCNVRVRMQYSRNYEIVEAITVRTSLDVPPVAPRICRSCGNPTHMLPTCPVLYYSDTNNDHSIQWSESAVGQAWLANGEQRFWVFFKIFHCTKFSHLTLNAHFRPRVRNLTTRPFNRYGRSLAPSLLSV